MRRDPWQPIGNAIYYAALATAALMGRPIVHRRGTLTNHHEQDFTEPRARWCINCDAETVWEWYRWVLEGEESFECVSCGLVE